MNKLLSVLVSFEIILILWFPFIGFQGKYFCHYGIYLLFFIALFKNDTFNDLICDFTNVPSLRALFQYVLLICVGTLAAMLMSNLFYWSFAEHNNLIRNLIYAYTFYVLFKRKSIRESAKYTLLFCGVTFGIYTLYSYITQTNIYTDYFSFFMDDDIMEGQFRDYSYERGISFRVYGNLNNPVFFSVELMLLLAFSCYEYLHQNNDKTLSLYKTFLLALVFLLLLSIMLTGSKSGLIPSLCIVLFTFYKSVGLKNVSLYFAIYLIVFLILLPSLCSVLNIDLYRFLDAMNPFNDSDEVGGSTAGSRMGQFSYLINFIKGDILFGHGYGWARHYTSTVGIHQVLHTFESLVMAAFVDNGIYGVCLVYPLFFYKLLKAKNDSAYWMVLLAYFFTMIVTGIGCFLEFVIILIYMSGNNTKRLYERIILQPIK